MCEPRRGDRCIAWGVSPRFVVNKKKRSRGAATDIFGEDSGSSQVQGQVPGTAIRGRVQIQRRFSGAEVRVREGAMVTSGSFKKGR